MQGHIIISSCLKGQTLLSAAQDKLSEQPTENLSAQKRRLYDRQEDNQDGGQIRPIKLTLNRRLDRFREITPSTCHFRARCQRNSNMSSTTVAQVKEPLSINKALVYIGLLTAKVSPPVWWCAVVLNARQRFPFLPFFPNGSLRKNSGSGRGRKLKTFPLLLLLFFSLWQNPRMPLDTAAAAAHTRRKSKLGKGANEASRS
jgi:hypothetical protein